MGICCESLAAYTHVSSTVSQIFEPQVQKNAIFTYCRTSTYHQKHGHIFLEHTVQCLSQCLSPKIAIFTTFLFPLGTPWGNHAKRCMDGKRIRCLQIVSHHVPMYLQQFPRYSNLKCKKTPFLRTAAHIFVSPGDAPATITQYVA